MEKKPVFEFRHKDVVGIFDLFGCHFVNLQPLFTRLCLEFIQLYKMGI